MFRLALIQASPAWNYDLAEKETTRRLTEEYVLEAAKNGANVVSLPEMWICPYAIKPMKLFAEEKGGDTYRFMSETAKKAGVYLIGGSICEREGDRYYNTCFVFAPDGSEAARHRKVHLFGIEVPGKQTFSEPRLFSPGEGATTFDTPWGRIGVAVCFDVRFKEPIEREALDGADLIVLPASFGTITGKAHWELLLRSRAVEYQLYFAGNNASDNPGAPYAAWGNSMIVDPWGDVIARAGSGTEIIYADIDDERIRTVRGQLPVMDEKMRLDTDSVKKSSKYSTK